MIGMQTLMSSGNEIDDTYTYTYDDDTDHNNDLYCTNYYKQICYQELCYTSSVASDSRLVIVY